MTLQHSKGMQTVCLVLLPSRHWNTQSLYEKKLVTYPRTDSQYLSDDMEGLQNVIEAIFNLLLFEQNIMFNPDIKRILNSKKVTDHHAIIPAWRSSAGLKGNPGERNEDTFPLCKPSAVCDRGEAFIIPQRQ